MVFNHAYWSEKLSRTNAYLSKYVIKDSRNIQKSRYVLLSKLTIFNQEHGNNWIGNGHQVDSGISYNKVCWSVILDIIKVTFWLHMAFFCSSNLIFKYTSYYYHAVLVDLWKYTCLYNINKLMMFKLHHWYTSCYKHLTILFRYLKPTNNNNFDFEK